jgi:hypothetical protein
MLLAFARVVTRFTAMVPLAMAASLVAPTVAQAQDPVVRDTVAVDSTRMYIMRTRDGSQIVGRLIRATVDSVYFVSSGGPITVPRSTVVELRQLGRGAMREGIYWAPNPNDTRLLFAPTGRMLARGEGYFSDTYLFLLLFAGGVTSRFTLGGGMSIVPSDDFFSNNIYYITPKVGIVQGETVNVAAGAFVGFAGWELASDTDDDIGSFGIVYGVATFGSPDAHFTVGSGLAYGGGDLADRPVFMLGGEKRLSRRTSFVSENYLLPGEANALISYGIRFFGEKLSVDLALWNAFGEDAEPIFPGIPYISFAVKF